MVIVSDTAKVALWVALQNSGAKEDEALRVHPGIEGFTLELDSPDNGDRVISYNDSPVVIINQTLDDEINDVLIDVGDNLSRMEISIRPFPGIPNNSCLRFGEGEW